MQYAYIRDDAEANISISSTTADEVRTSSALNQREVESIEGLETIIVARNSQI